MRPNWSARLAVAHPHAYSLALGLLAGIIAGIGRAHEGAGVAIGFAIAAVIVMYAIAYWFFRANGFVARSVQRDDNQQQ